MGRLRFFESLKYVLWEGNFKGAVVQWEIVVLAGLADPPSSGRREGRTPVVAHSSIYPLCLSHFQLPYQLCHYLWILTDRSVLDSEPPRPNHSSNMSFSPLGKEPGALTQNCPYQETCLLNVLHFCLARLQPSDFSQYWLSSLLWDSSQRCSDHHSLSNWQIAKDIVWIFFWVIPPFIVRFLFFGYFGTCWTSCGLSSGMTRVIPSSIEVFCSLCTLVPWYLLQVWTSCGLSSGMTCLTQVWPGLSPHLNCSCPWLATSYHAIGDNMQYPIAPNFRCVCISSTYPGESTGW